MEGTYDIPNKNPCFFVTTEPNRMFFAKMQIISYIFIILQHIQVSSQFRKLLMLKVRLSFLGGQSVVIYYIKRKQSVELLMSSCSFCRRSMTSFQRILGRTSTRSSHWSGSMRPSRVTWLHWKDRYWMLLLTVILSLISLKSLQRP